MRDYKTHRNSKVCGRCGFERPISDFPYSAGQYRFLCKEHWKEYCAEQRAARKKSGKQRKYDKERYWKNPQHFRDKATTEGQKYRKTVLEHYGGAPPACACCGEQIYEFLCIDHTDGGGEKHRRQEGIIGGASTYRWLIKKGFPKGFRVLCANCNSAYGFYGYCPHGKGH